MNSTSSALNKSLLIALHRNCLSHTCLEGCPCVDPNRDISTLSFSQAAPLAAAPHRALPLNVKQARPDKIMSDRICGRCR